MKPAEVRTSFEALDPDKRVRCLALLCEQQESRLRTYFSDHRRTKYRDSVVGLGHTVDVDLPFRVLAAVRSARGIPSSSVLDSLLADYQEPIVAHQDDDFVFADAQAEYAYLSIYNLARSCKHPDDQEMAWLVVRQAVSAAVPEEPAESDIDDLLNRWVADWATA